MAAQQPIDTEWVRQAQWTAAGKPSRRLVVAHDPVAGARRTQARQTAIDDLIKLGAWAAELRRTRQVGRALRRRGGSADFEH